MNRNSSACLRVTMSAQYLNKAGFVGLTPLTDSIVLVKESSVDLASDNETKAISK